MAVSNQCYGVSTLTHTPRKLTNRPWKSMVGRWIFRMARRCELLVSGSCMMFKLETTGPIIRLCPVFWPAKFCHKSFTKLHAFKTYQTDLSCMTYTVDGSEIRRSPAHYLRRVLYIPGSNHISSIKSISIFQKNQGSKALKWAACSFTPMAELPFSYVQSPHHPQTSIV